MLNVLLVGVCLCAEESMSSEWGECVELLPMVHDPFLQDHLLLPHSTTTTPLTPENITTLIQALKVYIHTDTVLYVPHVHIQYYFPYIRLLGNSVLNIIRALIQDSVHPLCPVALKKS